MKKNRKLNLKKINVAKINLLTSLKGGLTGPNTISVLQCPLTTDPNAPCNTTIIMGTMEGIQCNEGGNC